MKHLDIKEAAVRYCPDEYTSLQKPWNLWLEIDTMVCLAIPDTGRPEELENGLDTRRWTS
jgi:hypothetical protein